MAGQVVIPVLCKCFPERRLAPTQRGFQHSIYKQNKKYFGAAFAMALGYAAPIAPAPFYDKKNVA